MSYVIVDAEKGHTAEIAALERICFSCPWSQEQLVNQLKGEHHEFLAAIDEKGAVVGYAGMMYVLDEGYISNVAVAPEYRGTGIGDALISGMLDRAEGKEFSFVTLEVRESNEAAISLYKKHDFVLAGRRKGYYESPREDALLMTHFFQYGE